MGATETRVFVRPLANPLPLGLFSFGIGMLLLAAQTAGWVPLRETKDVGELLFTFVFPLEALAAVFAYLARDTVAGTVLGIFTTSWLALGLSLYTGTPGATVKTLGFFLLAFSVAVIALAAVASLGKPLLALILSLSAARAILDGLYQVTGATSLEHAAGDVAAVIAGVAAYAGTAFLLEDLRQSPVLPVFRRGAATQARDGSLSEQIGHAVGEAGVRQQL